MIRTILIPAAGRGTRLGSSQPKALTPVAGRPMIDWILRRHSPYCARVVVVIHPADRQTFETYRRQSGARIALAEQPAPTGMLDAILSGRDAVLETPSDRVWITWCDQVLISRDTVDRLASLESAAPEPAAVFPTSLQPQPYIHFDRNADGKLQRVRQRREGDDMPAIGESDAGLFSLSRATLTVDLPAFAHESSPGRATDERNFLPFLPWLSARAPVVTFPVPAHESLGVNTPEDLANAEAYFSGRE